MNLTLFRKDCCSDGIFSELRDESGTKLLVTLEHSYDGKPKLPNGIYTCRRGNHRLAGMVHDFETFEVMNVPGHSGVLFHCGNTQNDSEGCILLGLYRVEDAISHSRQAFADFMEITKGLNSFQLVVAGHDL